MKQRMSLLLTITCLLFFSCNSSDANNNPSNRPQKSIAINNDLEGAWRVVWAENNGNPADMRNHFQVKMFSGGSFSLIAHDSAGSIKFAGYGTYEFEGEKYHETFQYHTNRKYWGGMDWQNLQVNGDTMYLNGFTKVVVGGTDVTVGWPRIREKLVRVNGQ